jgi:outer membrane protein TolC
MKRTSMKGPFENKPGYAVVALLFFAVAATGVQAAPEEGRDAQLQELLEEAARNNPEIRVAMSEREAAQHRVAPAGALDDPILEAGVVNAPLASQTFRREDMTMKMLGLSQKFPYPGKRGLRQDVAAKDAESVSHAYQETVNRVARDVKAAYFELAFVVESARLVEKNRQILEQFLKISESRYAVGQGTQADVLKAQTQLTGMVDELIKLARERHAIEAELALALGRESDAGLPAPATLQLSETALRFDSLRETAQAERPQLLGLKSLIDRSAKSLDLARKDYYPDFDVKLSYGLREDMLDGTSRDDMVSLTVAFNLPVWRESKRDPAVAEAIAMHNQATDMYQAQLNEVSSQLRQQLASAEQSLKSARLHETGILPQARLAVESSLAAYRVNRVDFLTLLDDQMTVLNYEISYASALSNYNMALAEIGFLAGKAPF